MGALGIALAWKGARQAWGEGVALILGWIMALYPESVFSGCSQIREPFLLLFIAMLLWAATTWQGNRQRTTWIWLAGGTLGLFPVLSGCCSSVADCAGCLGLAGAQGSSYPLVVGGGCGGRHRAGRSAVQPDCGGHPSRPRVGPWRIWSIG